MDAIITGLLLSLFAGLSTAIGGLAVFFIKKFKDCYLAFSLAFSVGVMTTISFVELLPAGIDFLGQSLGLGFFALGAGIAFLVDYLLPHSYIMEKVSSKGSDFSPELFRVGLFVAIGLAIHNLPEGFAVFAGNLQSPELGVLLAVAIAIHNIPEGMSVSIPVYYATKNRKKAFFISFLSGIVEPIGALLAALVLLPFLSQAVVGASLAMVAGIMVYICVDELLPTAYNCSGKNPHIMGFAFLLGCLVMEATIILLP
ncbi:MAG: zinc transporter ZupT [Candidatus Diapherotrites archaeon]|uniref:Zinc transporter ZupT n=1 Tax=Candidatus Iainarchaeum sp. TaxID=3101447 RepID=A0A939C914_9ARCH|nr:zinc transporter ZupT [Candidatus Diapherotrites archaeon]